VIVLIISLTALNAILGTIVQKDLLQELDVALDSPVRQEPLRRNYARQEYIVEQPQIGHIGMRLHVQLVTIALKEPRLKLHAQATAALYALQDLNLREARLLLVQQASTCQDQPVNTVIKDMFVTLVQKPVTQMTMLKGTFVQLATIVTLRSVRQKLSAQLELTIQALRENLPMIVCHVH
jgi:hypothetical protein